MTMDALLMAAGAGTRVGAPVATQYLPLLGRPVLRHAAEALLREGLVRRILPVVAAGDEARVTTLLHGLPILPAVAGGVTRADSVRAGLDALAADPPDLILVHDAARPIIPAGTIAALRDALETNYRDFPIPVVNTPAGTFLELFHGPTGAFKDVALTMLPRIDAMVATEAKTYVTATSGDTGKAALEGFRDVPGVRICVFYPDGGVSQVQRAQMVTQEGGNVAVSAVQSSKEAKCSCPASAPSSPARLRASAWPSRGRFGPKAPRSSSTVSATTRRSRNCAKNSARFTWVPT